MSADNKNIQTDYEAVARNSYIRSRFVDWKISLSNTQRKSDAGLNLNQALRIAQDLGFGFRITLEQSSGDKQVYSPKKLLKRGIHYSMNTNDREILEVDPLEDSDKRSWDYPLVSTFTVPGIEIPPKLRILVHANRPPLLINPLDVVSIEAIRGETTEVFSEVSDYQKIASFQD